MTESLRLEDARETLTREEAFYFRNEGMKLFGVFHASTAVVSKGGVVLCAPYGEEKNYTQRALANFARAVCSKGFDVVRFDYRGTGDSEGDLEDVSLTDHISDIDCAIGALGERRGTKGIGLLGLRLGGTLAALVANNDPRIQFAILWAPIARPKRYFQGLFKDDLIAEAWGGDGVKVQSSLEQELGSEGLVELRECSLTRRAYDEFSSIDLTEDGLSFDGDLLIADVIRRSRAHDAQIKGILDICTHMDDRYEFKLVEDAHFWSTGFVYHDLSPRALCDETLEWLVRKRGGEER